MTHILVVDNYDSFVYTIAGYIEELGAQCTVVRNDAVAMPGPDGRFLDATGAPYDGVLISPGPGTPAQAGRSPEAIRACAAAGIPLLGVCLGHQALAEVYGATVAHAPELMHGKTSRIEHSGVGVLAGLPSPCTVTRYHSLAVEPATIPDDLEVCAVTSSGIIMAIRHRTLPLFGVQFHPESVLTEGGYRIVANWLAVCGSTDAVERSTGMVPVLSSAPAQLAGAER